VVTSEPVPGMSQPLREGTDAHCGDRHALRRAGPGERFAGDPRSIKLTPHAVIQLDIGKVVPPQPFTFPAGL
jgi:hypothetical protein